MAAAAVAQADPDFPTKPIRLIVPVAPGGGNDITARAIAQKLTQAWGQQVIVDNRAGASGAIAFEIAVKATPDGHTLLMMAASHPINTVALANWPYDVSKDVAAVSQATSLSYVVYTHPSVPFGNFKELLAAQRLLGDGSEPVGSSAEQFGALIRAEISKWRKVLQETGIVLK